MLSGYFLNLYTFRINKLKLEEYLNNIPENRKERFRLILDIIKSLYPEAEESMKYKMPTYISGDGWIASANQKNYISVYTCSAEHLSDFKKKHPAIKTGKGCINFKDSDDIPIDDLKTVIKKAMSSGHQ